MQTLLPLRSATSHLAELQSTPKVHVDGQIFFKFPLYYCNTTSEMSERMNRGGYIRCQYQIALDATRWKIQ